MDELKKILGAVYRKDRAVLEELSPADMRLRDEDGRTPLMHAALAEDADPAIIKLLTERGADVNAVEHGEKWSALHFAARDQKQTVVRVLLAAGAAVDAVNASGNTPLWESLMASSPERGVALELIEHGADPFRKNIEGVAPVDVARKRGHAGIVRLLKERSQP